MKVKMKVRQKFKFTATVALLAFSAGNKGYSQNTSQAVMDVKVTIVAGSHHTDNTISNISDQISNKQDRLSFGNHKLVVHEDSDYLVEHNANINMKNGTDNWNIQTNMTEEDLGNGELKLHLGGRTTSKIPSGVYSGRHTTEIHYL